MPFENTSPHKTRAIFLNFSKAVIVTASLIQSEHSLTWQRAAKFNRIALPAIWHLTLWTLRFLYVTKCDVFCS